MLGSAGEPAGGFPVVRRDSLFFIAFGIEAPQLVLGNGIALLRQLVELFETGRIDCWG